ncbi:MAG: hypothetical protein KAR20_27675 [Candidatus Heimdallarchaeota archaeon]|nr:hypothetical protein [Candidatus Heimdallarchaeota archaeon]
MDEIKIEVYYKEGRRTRISVTPERVTIKVSEQLDIPIEAFETLAEAIAMGIKVKQSFRGHMSFYSDSHASAKLYSNRKKSNFVIYYNFEAETLGASF